MSKLKAVFFDLDDTLLWDAKSVQEAFEATCQYAAQKHPLSPTALEKAVRQAARELYETYDTYPFTQMIGINPFEGLWGEFKSNKLDGFKRLREIVPHYRREAWTAGLKSLGIDDPELGQQLGERFPLERRKRSIVYSDTYKVLDELKQHYRLLLLTNGSPDLQREKLAMEPKLAPYFEQIIISGEFGKGKPDPAIFHYALEKMQLQPNEAMMVGDKLSTDILGSHRIGMKNVWINRDNQPPRPELVRPDFEISTLSELINLIQSIAS